MDVYTNPLAEAYELLSSHTNYSTSSGSNKQMKENKQTNNNTANEQQGARSNDLNNNQSENTGISYLQAEIVPGMDGRTVEHITCYNCGKRGHYAANFPVASNECTMQEQHAHIYDRNSTDGGIESDVDEQMMQLEDITEEAGDDEIVHFSWSMILKTNGNNYLDMDILLDTGSTFSVFKNHQMV